MPSEFPSDPTGRRAVWRRVAVTIGALAVLRAGGLVPVPGLDPTLLDVLTRPEAGLALERVSVMALGVLPWFNALLIAELLTLLIPAARRWRDDATSATVTFDRAIVVLSLIFAVLQAWGLAGAMQQVPGLVTRPGLLFQLAASVTIVGGTVITLWLAMLVTRSGIGSGFWVMLAAPIVLGLPRHVSGYAALLVRGDLSAAGAMVAVLIALASIVLVVALLIRRQQEGRDDAADVIWPPLLAAVGVGWVSVLPSLLPDPVTRHVWTTALAPGGPLSLLLLAVFIALIVGLYGRFHPGRALAGATAVVLVAVVLAPELALFAFGVPILLDGRWVVLLVAVLFTFAKVWQTPQQERPSATSP